MKNLLNCNLSVRDLELFLEVNAVYVFLLTDQFSAMFSERIQHNIEMDKKAKMREDPMFAIRYVFVM